MVFYKNHHDDQVLCVLKMKKPGNHSFREWTKQCSSTLHSPSANVTDLHRLQNIRHTLYIIFGTIHGCWVRLLYLLRELC